MHMHTHTHTPMLLIDFLNTRTEIKHIPSYITFVIFVISYASNKSQTRDDYEQNAYYRAKTDE